MKKVFICCVMLVALLGASASHAAAPKKMTAQQNRMKMCAVQYHEKKIPKHDYRKFMSQCLRTHPKDAKAKIPSAVPPTPIGPMAAPAPSAGPVIQVPSIAPAP